MNTVVTKVFALLLLLLGVQTMQSQEVETQDGKLKRHLITTSAIHAFSNVVDGEMEITSYTYRLLRSSGPTINLGIGFYDNQTTSAWVVNDFMASLGWTYFPEIGNRFRVGSSVAVGVMHHKGREAVAEQNLAFTRVYFDYALELQYFDTDYGYIAFQYRKMHAKRLRIHALGVTLGFLF